MRRVTLSILKKYRFLVTFCLENKQFSSYISILIKDSQKSQYPTCGIAGYALETSLGINEV